MIIIITLYVIIIITSLLNPYFGPGALLSISVLITLFVRKILLIIIFKGEDIETQKVLLGNSRISVKTLKLLFTP